MTFGYCSMPTSRGCWQRNRWRPSGLVKLPDFHTHVMSQLPRAASGQKALLSLLPLNTFPRLLHKVRGVSPLKSMLQAGLAFCPFISSVLPFSPQPLQRTKSLYCGGQGSPDANVVWVNNFKYNFISAWHLQIQKANLRLSPFCFLLFTFILCPFISNSRAIFFTALGH